jgi:hypothetical protein
MTTAHRLLRGGLGDIPQLIPGDSDRAFATDAVAHRPPAVRRAGDPLAAAAARSIFEGVKATAGMLPRVAGAATAHERSEWLAPSGSTCSAKRSRWRCCRYGGADG